jgi:DNA-binding MarR family transcriptional regulator
MRRSKAPGKGHGARTTAGRSGDQQRWAELADLVLIIAREIQFRGYTDRRAISLSQSEGMVMRYLQRQTGVAPTEIAAATGLQRTNLSTVLGGLERKRLIERRACAEDARGIAVHRTERGASNYALVRREWAEAVSAAADQDARNLDAALGLLRAVERGLVATRPRNPAFRSME